MHFTCKVNKEVKLKKGILFSFVMQWLDVIIRIRTHPDVHARGQVQKIKDKKVDREIKRFPNTCQYPCCLVKEPEIRTAHHR